MVRLLAVTLLAVPSLASAATIYAGGPGGFPTIQAAIDAAQEGDTIVIASGTYNEQLVINDAAIQDLTLKAATGASVTVAAPNSKINTILATDVNLNLKGFTIAAPNHQNPADNGVKFMTDDGTGVTYTLTVCSMNVTDKSGAGNYAFLGAPAAGDAVVARGFQVTTASTFIGNVSSVFNFSGGWNDGMDCAF